MTTVRYQLKNGSYFMDWYLDAITTNNDWSNVPSIVGYLGSGLTSTPGVDPRTLTAPDPSPTVGVIANQTDPYDTTLGAAGGIVEFQIGDNNMIALGGSDTADAPNLVLYLDSTDRQSVTVSFLAYDLETTAGSDNALTPLVVQYRTSTTGDWVNVYYNPDITKYPEVPQQPFVGVTANLPADANNCATLEVRIMTTNAAGNDEWVGIDNLTVQSLNAADPPPPPQGALSVTGGGNFVEGDSGLTPVTYTITRLGGSQGAVGVTYQLQRPSLPGGASDDDFGPGGAPFFGTLSFADGEVSKTLTFYIKGDTIVELDESFNFILVAPTGGATLGQSSAQGRIINDDVQKPIVTVNDVTVTEGTGGTVTATFTITRTNNSAAFDVDYATANGTALAGADYTSVSGTLHFDAGQNSRTVVVTINPDALVEADEDFFLNLSNISFGTISDGQGRAIINNDDSSTQTGTPGDDVMDGLGSDNILIGLGGNDTYFVDDDEDLVVEAVGGGFDAVYTNTDYRLTADAEVEWLSTTSAIGTTAINLTGSDANQYLLGNQGANILDGGKGADVLLGYGGDDTYYVDDPGDLIDGEGPGNGIDKVIVSGSYILTVGAEIESMEAINATGTQAWALTGNEFGQRITGNAGTNLFWGVGGADVLVGLRGNDTYIVDADDTVLEESGDLAGSLDAVYALTSFALSSQTAVEWLSAYETAATTAINLTGNERVQYLVGNAGANVLDGGGGSDILIGYGGADTFQFTTIIATGNSAVNIDTIADFVSGTDRIALDDAIFTALAGSGTLGASAFVTGTAAADADDRIIYDSANGRLYYDADGSGAGKAILFANLQGGPTLAASDFLVI